MKSQFVVDIIFMISRFVDATSIRGTRRELFLRAKKVFLFRVRLTGQRVYILVFYIGQTTVDDLYLP
jgi:hypothetical protein